MWDLLLVGRIGFSPCELPPMLGRSTTSKCYSRTRLLRREPKLGCGLSYQKNGRARKFKFFLYPKVRLCLCRLEIAEAFRSVLGSSSAACLDELCLPRGGRLRRMPTPPSVRNCRATRRMRTVCRCRRRTTQCGRTNCRLSRPRSRQSRCRCGATRRV